jgi:glucosyl-dolichyl phosphate glucuronosyltransferase
VNGVTVAICTWNRSALLERTLDQMTKLLVPSDVRWELVVVENNCTDATADVVARFTSRLPLRVIRESQPGLSHARNRVIREAKDELLLWTDDDVLVDPGWLRAFVDSSRMFPEAAAFGGPIDPWFLNEPDADLIAAFPSLATGFCGLESNIPAGPISSATPIWGANMGFRRNAIAGLTFDETLGPSPTFAGGGDEVDFLRRLRERGGSVVWSPDMRVKHCVSPSRMTLAYLKNYTFAKGSEHVRLSTSAASSGRSVAGVPLWLWRDWAKAVRHEFTVRSRIPVRSPTRLRSGPGASSASSARVKLLVAVRERLFIAGMLDGFRRLTHERATIGQSAFGVDRRAPAGPA